MSSDLDMINDLPWLTYGTSICLSNREMYRYPFWSVQLPTLRAKNRCWNWNVDEIGSLAEFGTSTRVEKIHEADINWIDNFQERLDLQQQFYQTSYTFKYMIGLLFYLHTWSPLDSVEVVNVKVYEILWSKTLCQLGLLFRMFWGSSSYHILWEVTHLERSNKSRIIISSAPL